MENFFNQIFSSYEEFNKKFIEWQDANFQLITINKCDKFKQGTDEFKTRFKYERVRFHCHHSGNQKSGKILNATQVGSRNNTHTVKMDCPFKATLSYNFQQDCLKFNTTSLQHNHAISKEIYNSYSQVTTRKIKMNPNAKHLQETLDKAKATTYNQVIAINDEFGINASAKDINNLRQSTKPIINQTDQTWQEIQLLLQREPNSVKIFKNAEEEVECIFIQTSFMKDWYIKHPEIHHVDSTFRVNIENFQLYISMVVDAAGKGVPTGYCFMKSACKVSTISNYITI